MIKEIFGGILFVFFLFVFIASVRERNLCASILWGIPLIIFIVCATITVISKF